MTTKTEPTEAIDVRVLVPIERHKLLLKKFKDLPVGETFTFINDHDPIPLFYEFRSIHGDVVGWDYLERGGTDWKVKVTRLEASKGRDLGGVATLMDLRKVAEAAWKHVVFHRYGMMEEGDTMEIIAEKEPKSIHEVFDEKFAGQHVWAVRKSDPGEYVVHVTKKVRETPAAGEIRVVNEFDVRPYEPAERHERFYAAFAAIHPGEAFIFTNDHDPKPLYYQMEAESPDPFKWEYLESGPEAWKVKVSKPRQ